MKNHHSKEELKEREISIITGMLKHNPSGMMISSLEEALNGALSYVMNRRTLLRRLSIMKERGQLMTAGRGNKVYYSLLKELYGFQSSRSYYLSEEADNSLSYVHQPVSRRKPVGYNPDFLDAYKPDETYYLPLSLRQQLKTMGRTNFQPQSESFQPDTLEKVGETYVRHVYHRLLVDLSWASSHLEGNTYTRLETQNLIAFGQIAVGKDWKETQMILNHKTAIEMLVGNSSRISFDPYTILTLHANLSDNLLPDPLDSGRLRQSPVEISGTTYLPMAVPDRIQLTFQKILQKASAITDPYEQSFFVTVHLPYLQPFIDVNKRVSRLASNIPFIRHGLCPLSFIDVDEKLYMDGLLAVYELNDLEVLKEAYLLAYERSCQRYGGVVQTMSEPNPLRMRNRKVIFLIVKEIVEHMAKPTIERINQALEAYPYDPLDRRELQDLIVQEFTYLHEGNIGRYGLMPSQYHKWKS